MEPFSKETDGFMARLFDRKISGAISRWLLKTPVTPNQITIAVTCLGLVAGTYMAQAGDSAKIMGAFLFLLTSILDGCDGEVARAKMMTSRLGGWLDLWGDNIVHVAIFYGLGVGLFRDSGHDFYLNLGIAASAGTLVSTALASYQTWKKTLSASPPSRLPGGEGGLMGEASLFTSVAGDASRVRGLWQQRLVRWSDALARRDFIYGVVVLALISRLEWFLWAGAIGSNIYALVMVALLIVSTPSSRKPT